MTLLKRRILRIGAVSVAALLAISCAETQLGAQAVKQVARSDAPTNAEPELAPEAFDATGLTIWDGASTLEGVWVAHPLAQRAQRVRVTNEENSIIIEGAMFRRDPTLSGPSILVSSDAARLLGLQPGVPTELRIIALREGVYAAPTTATTPSDSAETGSVETAALAAPEPQESEAVEELSTAEATTETATEKDAPKQPAFSATDGETEETEAAAPTEDAAPENPATPAEPASTTSDEPATATVAAPAPAVRERERPKTAITAADLRGETTVAAAPAQPAAASAQPAPPEPAAAPAQQAPAAKPEPTQTASAEQTTAPASSGAFQGQLPSGRFVQAGAFSVEPNAASLVQTLKGAGLPAQYVVRDVNGSALNIVMIGPLADDAAADAAIAAAAKAGAPGARKVIR